MKTNKIKIFFEKTNKNIDYRTKNLHIRYKYITFAHKI